MTDCHNSGDNQVKGEYIIDNSRDQNYDDTQRESLFPAFIYSMNGTFG
jgi:hypothetical protein